MYFLIEAILSLLIEDGNGKTAQQFDVTRIESEVFLGLEVLSHCVEIIIIADQCEMAVFGIHAIVFHSGEHEIQNVDFFEKIDGGEELVVVLET